MIVQDSFKIAIMNWRAVTEGLIKNYFQVCKQQEDLSQGTEIPERITTNILLYRLPIDV